MIFNQGIPVVYAEKNISPIKIVTQTYIYHLSIYAGSVLNIFFTSQNWLGRGIFIRFVNRNFSEEIAIYHQSN
jgi:hypothetical protein